MSGGRIDKVLNLFYFLNVGITPSFKNIQTDTFYRNAIFNTDEKVKFFFLIKFFFFSSIHFKLVNTYHNELKKN